MHSTSVLSICEPRSNVKRHAQLERALNGSAPDLEALYSLTGLRRTPPPFAPPPSVVPSAKLIPPPRPPPPTKGHVANVYRAPTIHFSQYGIPIFVPPVVKPSRKAQYETTSKIKQFRRYSETLSVWLSYQYHATFEEQFLRNIASTYNLRQGMNVEAGRREVNGMVSLIRRAMANMAWVEDVRVEKQIKDWVRMHPGAGFRPYGQAMTRARKRELKVWEAEVRRFKKKIQMEREKARFMKKWEKQWGSKPLIPFIHPRQRRLKYAARKKRKVRMGHPERVLKRNA